MASRPADASSSDPAQARILELEALSARLAAEKAARFAEEQDLRRQENPAQRVSFAKEIFELQHEQRRLEVEVLFVEQKIRRLRLGFAEDDAGADPSGGFAL